MNTQQVIEALKASVGSYFWESFVTGRTYAGSEESGHISLKWFGDSTFLKIRDGRIFSVHGIEFTLEEAKTLLGVHATAWERAHPEGALIEPLRHPWGVMSNEFRYAGLEFKIHPQPENDEGLDVLGKRALLSIDYEKVPVDKAARVRVVNSFEEAEKAGRDIIHDHLKSQLKP